MYQDLLEQLNPKAPLLLLAKKIPWTTFEKEFAPLYADFGRPAKPIRLMVGLLLLKQLENLSSDFRLARNYLKGTVGDAINLLLAVAAFNCRKWMKAVAEGLLIVLFALYVIMSQRHGTQLETA